MEQHDVKNETAGEEANRKCLNTECPQITKICEHHFNALLNEIKKKKNIGRLHMQQYTGSS
jgi:hypothetical protein